MVELVEARLDELCVLDPLGKEYASTVEFKLAIVGAVPKSSPRWRIVGEKIRG